MRQLSRKPRAAVQNPSRAFGYPGTRVGSSPRPRAPQKAPHAQPGGLTRGAARSLEGRPAWGQRRSQGAKVSAMGFLVNKVELTYLLTYHRPGPLVKGFSAFVFALSLPKPGCCP